MIDELTEDKATTRLSDTDSWVTGKVTPRTVEEAPTFDAFIQELQSNLETAKGEVEAEENKQNPAARARLAYAAAIYRDARYVLAGRGRMQELGIHNMFREAYEVGKAAVTVDYSEE